MPRRYEKLFFRLVRIVPDTVRQWVVRLVKPSFTLGASCLFHRDGRVLMVSHSYRDGWGLPGGLVNRGESPDETIIREVREEIGFEFAPLGDPISDVEWKYRRVSFRFVEPLPAHVAVDEVASTTAEIDEVGWFSPDALPPMHSEVARSMSQLLPRLPSS